MAHDIESMLAREEGRRNVAYLDTLGKPTIGIGHYSESLAVGDTWTDEQIDDAFKTDVADSILLCRNNFPWFTQLDDARQGALVGMAFQLGHRLLQFKGMLGALRDARWNDAWAEALDSAWAHQTPARAKRMAEQLRDGVWS